jgi:hypothetical protein
MRRLRMIVTFALITLPVLAFADNDKKKSEAKPTEPVTKQERSIKAARRKNPESKPSRKVTVDQEATAIALVRKHHKELYTLLTSLKESVPLEYDRAIRELSRSSDRLAQLKKRDSKRYKIELRLWQVRSQRQLLTARLQMGQDESLLDELRDTLNDEHELSLAILQHERDRLTRRLAKLEDQINKQETKQEASVERKLNALKKAARRRADR